MSQRLLQLFKLEMKKPVKRHAGLISSEVTNKKPLLLGIFNSLRRKGS
jgi:hypothetical protein